MTDTTMALKSLPGAHVKPWLFLYMTQNVVLILAFPCILYSKLMGLTDATGLQCSWNSNHNCMYKRQCLCTPWIHISVTHLCKLLKRIPELYKYGRVTIHLGAKKFKFLSLLGFHADIMNHQPWQVFLFPYMGWGFQKMLPYGEMVW